MKSGILGGECGCERIIKTGPHLPELLAKQKGAPLLAHSVLTVSGPGRVPKHYQRCSCASSWMLLLLNFQCNKALSFLNRSL